MKKHAYLLFFVLIFTSCNVKNETIKQSYKEKIVVEPIRPKLVVGIVVDQMRYDYLTRFSSKYGNGGFKRLITEGFNCKNNHFNYVPTYTGPGHASVFTGTTPKMHGVISNYWYDKVADKDVYCAGDKSVESVGTTDKAGQMSPHRLKTTSFADENRLFTQMKGKTVQFYQQDIQPMLPIGFMVKMKDVL